MKNSLMIAGIAIFILFSCSPTRTADNQNGDKSEAAESSQTSAIANKYWKLITLEGKKVTMAPNQEREAYFTLKTDENENRINGFAGCNSFTGTYTLEKGWRIRFSHMATTMKACPDVNVNESEFLKVFELADNYTIKDDKLSLNVGRRAPLAVFEAVYLK